VLFKWRPQKINCSHLIQYLGLKIEQYKNKEWFPVLGDKMLKAKAIYQKYGYCFLLLSWLLIIGDLITLIT